MDRRLALPLILALITFPLGCSNDGGGPTGPGDTAPPVVPVTPWWQIDSCSGNQPYSVELRWPGSRPTPVFTFGSALPSAWRDLSEFSASAWNATASGIEIRVNRTVTPLDSAKDSKNIITYGSLTGQLLGVTSLWYDSKTKTILEADIKLNATLPLVNGQQRGGYDVRSVLTHEFGHFIGLGHVSDRTHTMYPGVHDDSTIYRTLCSGDIAGARRAYGTR